MATVNLIDPYSQQAEEIARRQRMAQALQESGSQVLQMPTTPGVAISPYAGLAKILEAGLGSYQEKKARQDYAKLQNEYRDKYNTQFGDLARAISAPAVEGVIGQEATKDIPGWTRPLGLDTSVSGGTEMFEDVAPVQGKPAIPARPALPAGYISPETLKGFDIPEVKALAMAKYLAQFEPKQVKLGQNERLLEQTGSGPFRELAGVSTTPKVLEPKWEATVQKINGVDTPGWINVNAGADKAASTFVAGGKPEKIAAHWEATTQQVGGNSVAGWINLNAADKAASFVAGAKPTEAKAATPHWVEGQKDVNGKTQFGWYDLNSANKDASFKAGANPPAGEKSNWKEVNRDGKVFYEDFNIADDTQRQAKARVKEAAKVDQIQLEVQDDSGAKKTILVNKDDPRLKEGIATKGADTVMITEVNDKGQPLVRYVKKGDPILATGYVKPLDGFLGQLQQAGVPMDRIQNDPKIRDLVDRYFVKTAGGVAPEEAAGFELRKAEVIARLGELNIVIPANIKGLSLSATPGVLGGTQSASAAPAIAKAPPKINDVVVNGDKKFKFKGGDPNQQSNWVEVK
jgi:hypothetical protein